MRVPDELLLDRVGGAVGADALSKAVVYLGTATLREGVHGVFGDVDIVTPWDAFVVFVDLEPGVNWGHACCYLALRQDADDLIRIEASMPPFLKAGSPAFRLLLKGPLAPEWSIASPDH